MAGRMRPAERKHLNGITKPMDGVQTVTTFALTRPIAWAIFVGTGLTSVTGCNEAAKPTAAPPPTVQVVKVEQKDMPIYSEWVGTTDGLINAKIRAQVAGYLLKQHFREGAAIKKGDLLFEIDSRKFQAAFDQAASDLKRAQVQRLKAERDVARNEPLAKEGAISRKNSKTPFR